MAGNDGRCRRRGTRRGRSHFSPHAAESTLIIPVLLVLSECQEGGAAGDARESRRRASQSNRRRFPEAFRAGRKWNSGCIALDGITPLPLYIRRILRQTSGLRFRSDLSAEPE